MPITAAAREDPVVDVGNLKKLFCFRFCGKYFQVFAFKKFGKNKIAVYGLRFFAVLRRESGHVYSTELNLRVIPSPPST